LEGFPSSLVKKSWIHHIEQFFFDIFVTFVAIEMSQDSLDG